MIRLKSFPVGYVSMLLATFGMIFLLPPALEFSPESEHVDLLDLASNTQVFLGKRVKTSGTVRFFASFYMYEDFWLATDKPSHAAIPVVVRFTGLPRPKENTKVEIIGAIEYCTLEGGFYYLKATSLKYL